MLAVWKVWKQRAHRRPISGHLFHTRRPKASSRFCRHSTHTHKQTQFRVSKPWPAFGALPDIDCGSISSGIWLLLFSSSGPQTYINDNIFVTRKTSHFSTGGLSTPFQDYYKFSLSVFSNWICANLFLSVPFTSRPLFKSEKLHFRPMKCQNNCMRELSSAPKMTVWNWPTTNIDDGNGQNTGRMTIFNFKLDFPLLV